MGRETLKLNREVDLGEYNPSCYAGMDIGTPDRHRHSDIVLEGEQLASITPHARVVDVFDGYERRGHITHEQWLAGDKLRQDRYVAGYQPKCTSSMTDAPGGGRSEISDRMIDARTRYNAAMDRLGPLGRPIVAHVVFNDQPAHTFLDAAYKKTAAKTISIALLRMALDLLGE